MSDDKINYNDGREYESFFRLAPSFLLEAFARKNSNIVLKFKPQILANMSKLDERQKKKLDLILNTDIGELQSIMKEAYAKTRIKQYKVLANPKYHAFIEENLNELRKLM